MSSPRIAGNLGLSKSSKLSELLDKNILQFKGQLGVPLTYVCPWYLLCFLAISHRGTLVGLHPTIPWAIHSRLQTSSNQLISTNGKLVVWDSNRGTPKQQSLSFSENPRNPKHQLTSLKLSHSPGKFRWLEDDCFLLGPEPFSGGICFPPAVGARFAQIPV